MTVGRGRCADSRGARASRRAGGDRRRLRVIGVVVVLALMLGGCDWAKVGFGPDQRNYNPSEPALNETSFSTLRTAWLKPCGCDDKPALGGLQPVVEGRRSKVLRAVKEAFFPEPVPAPRRP